MSAQPQTPPLDGPLANEDDLDKALNDWPPTNTEGEQQ